MYGPPDTCTAGQFWKPSLKPTFLAVWAGIIGVPAPNSAFQSLNGLAKTTVTVLPLLEPVTDLIEL
jgi:hypothetical protein